MTIRLGPTWYGDEEFLFSVYASAAQKQEFLRMHFRAQDHSCKENIQAAAVQLILLDTQRR